MNNRFVRYVSQAAAAPSDEVFDGCLPFFFTVEPVGALAGFDSASAGSAGGSWAWRARAVCCAGSNARVMPRKTFTHGGATVLAMDRPGDQRGIIVERANDRMLVQEWQRLLARRRALQELPQRAEPECAAVRRFPQRKGTRCPAASLVRHRSIFPRRSSVPLRLVCEKPTSRSISGI